MVAETIASRDVWDGFVASQPEAQFVQSWQWGVFQESTGKRIFRFGVRSNGKLRGAALAILQEHGLGIVSVSVFRGPTLDVHLPVAEYRATLTLLLDTLRATARNEGATYLRIEPAVLRQSPAARFYPQEGWKVAPRIQPGRTLLINLADDENALLQRMHPKTRYNVRLAERKGVSVRQDTSDDAINAFLRLAAVTAKRDGIRFHADDYYRAMVRGLSEQNMAAIFLADYEGTTIAANILVRFGDMVTYLHGTSSNEHRSVMAPQLLQWEQIRWAKELGCRWYDFWGVAPEGALANHPWAGISRFKHGFGGETREYGESKEIPLRPVRYRLVRLRRRVRG